MTNGEAVYLALVVGVILTFGVTLAWGSWQSGRDRTMTLRDKGPL